MAFKAEMVVQGTEMNTGWGRCGREDSLKESGENEQRGSIWDQVKVKNGKKMIKVK